MDSKSTWLCRLCLEICNETMNIFENFQNTTIASILTQHFWFKVDHYVVLKILFVLQCKLKSRFRFVGQ